MLSSLNYIWHGICGKWFWHGILFGMRFAQILCQTNIVPLRLRLNSDAISRLQLSLNYIWYVVCSIWYILWHRYFGTDILGWDILAQIFLKIFLFWHRYFYYPIVKVVTGIKRNAKSGICHRGLV